MDTPIINQSIRDSSPIPAIARPGGLISLDRIEIEHKEELFTAPPLLSELYSCSLNPGNYIPFLPFLGPRMPREIEAATCFLDPSEWAFWEGGL